MPLYDFDCGCGESFEEIVSMEDRRAECPECGKVVKASLSGGHFMLMGGGWTRKGHVKIHPPQSDPSLTHGWKDNYYNCTPESVHKT